MEGALSDSKTKRLIESYAIPSLKKNDWNSGILNLYMAVYQEICKEYGIEVPSEIASLPNSNTLSVEDFIFVEHISIVGTLLTAFGLFFFAVIFFAVRRFRKRRRFRDIFFDSDNDDFHHHFFSGGGFSSSGGDGGFFGGGSSFSGGGGDFGGGGASGDF